MRAVEACAPSVALAEGMISVIRPADPLLPDDVSASDPGVVLEVATTDLGVAARAGAAIAAAGAAKSVTD
ncbi:MAG: hypothetical protein ACREMR_01005 [Gemmatimonadales bacterium]